MNDVDVLILTKNEELNLPFALQSTLPWARKVFVLDSESTDRTRNIAVRMGAEVVVQPWLGYAKQKNWGLDNLPIEAPWVLILDADESVQPDLLSAINEIRGKSVDSVSEAGFYVNRYFVFLGKRIRHCGYYPSYNLRFFKRGCARYEERDVHEHMVAEGKVGYLRGHLEHNDRRGLHSYMDKHNKYSTLEALEIHRVISGKQASKISANFLGSPIERRRWIKERVYPALPAKWAWRFGFMYLLRLGFLDGAVGLKFSLLLSAYELLIDLKLHELKLDEETSRAGTTVLHANGPSQQ